MRTATAPDESRPNLAPRPPAPPPWKSRADQRLPSVAGGLWEEPMSALARWCQTHPAGERVGREGRREGGMEGEVAKG